MMGTFSDQKCTNMVTRASPSTMHPSEWYLKNPNHMLPLRKKFLVIPRLPMASVVSLLVNKLGKAYRVALVALANKQLSRC